MRLYIKQKVFSFGDKYNIYDEAGNEVYWVEGEVLTFTPKIHLMDLNDNELFFIKKRFTFLVAEYEIYQGDRLCATVEQELKLFSNKLHVQSDYGNFEINGSFSAYDLEILCNGVVKARIQKKWLSWGDTYEMDILDEENVPFFCALVIAIDNCLHNENK